MSYVVRRQVPANTLLERFEPHMLARGLSSRAITDRLRTIRNLADDRPPESLDALTVARALASPDWSQASRCTHWSEMSAWFQFLIAEGVRDDFPTPPRPRQPSRYARPVAPEHVKRLIESPRLRHRTRVMILLAALAGLRVHEIAKVRGEDVDVLGRTLLVNSKGGGRHVLPLHLVLAELAATMPLDGWWFRCCTPGEGFDYTRHVGGKSMSDRVGRAMRRNGVPGTPHGLRHYIATSLVQNNVYSGGPRAVAAQIIAIDTDLHTYQRSTAPSRHRNSEYPE